MKTRRAWLAVVVLFVLGLGVSVSRANSFTSRNTDCQFKEISIGGEKWAELRVKYVTQMDSKWLDALTVDFYVAAAPDPNVSGIRDAKPVLFHKQVTYVDIDDGNHEAVVYLHYNTYERYITRTSRSMYAVVFSAQGKEISVADSEKQKKGKWWDLDGLVKKPGYLMSRDESPFYDQGPSNYEMIQPKER
jgi:hypothetical protein